MSCRGCFSTAFPGCGWYNPARKRKSGKSESCIHINHNLRYTGKGMGVRRAQTPQNRPIEKTGGTEHETQIPYTHQLFIDRQPVHRAAQRHRSRRRPTGRYSGRPNRDRDRHHRYQARHPRPRPDHDDHDDGEGVGGDDHGIRNNNDGKRRGKDDGYHCHRPGRRPARPDRHRRGQRDHDHHTGRRRHAHAARHTERRGQQAGWFSGSNCDSRR